MAYAGLAVLQAARALLDRGAATSDMPRAAARTDGRSAARPNVLMLIIDDLRADLGSYGRAWARTPHMDALATESVIFLQAHAAVANCAPSRGVNLTITQEPRPG